MRWSTTTIFPGRRLTGASLFKYNLSPRCHDKHTIHNNNHDTRFSNVKHLFGFCFIEAHKKMCINRTCLKICMPPGVLESLKKMRGITIENENSPLLTSPKHGLWYHTRTTYHMKSYIRIYIYVYMQDIYIYKHYHYTVTQILWSNCSFHRFQSCRSHLC